MNSGTSTTAPVSSVAGLLPPAKAANKVRWAPRQAIRLTGEELQPMRQACARPWGNSALEFPSHG